MTSQPNDLEILASDVADFNHNDFLKLPLSIYQKSQMSRLATQLPDMTDSDTLARAYTIKFIEGVTDLLIKYVNGGYDTASLVNIIGEIAAPTLLNAFTILSYATNQHFMTEINSQLRIVNEKLDKIISFLHGEHRAELLSEIRFVKYAHENFNSIVQCESQRIATITNLQAARKVAMKNIELYTSEFHNLRNKKEHEKAELAVNTKETLEQAVELYVSSSIMELYYSGNMDPGYMSCLKSDLEDVINKYKVHVMDAYSRVAELMDRGKGLFRKSDENSDRIKLFIAQCKDGQKSRLEETLDKVLDPTRTVDTYFLTASGDVYIRS